MKHRASFLCMLACALCLVAGLAGCSGSQAYEPEAATPAIATPAIAEDGVLHVGVEGAQSAPFTLASDDEVVGLDIDMAAAIADELGLSLEIVDVDSDGGAAALKNGEIDILMSAVESDENDTVWVSEPYVPTAIALFAASGTEVPTRESAPTIAAQSTSTSAWAVTTIFGDDALMSSKDLTSAFSSAEGDKADYVAADIVIGVYAALYQNVDLEPIALLEQPGGYCVAAAADNIELQQAVTDALAAIAQGGVDDVIVEKWLGRTLDLGALPVVDTSQKERSAAPQRTDDDADDAEKGTSSAIDANSPDAGANAIIPDSSAAQGAGAAGQGASGAGTASGADQGYGSDYGQGAFGGSAQDASTPALL